MLLNSMAWVKVLPQPTLKVTLPTSFVSRPKERHHGVHGVHSDQLLNLKGLISVHWKLGWCKKTPRK